ncbi:EamA/RhaT family transporter [Kitasatospora sp. NPDC056181]|uniref:EamA/RhaT family transporter n=1 Tax=Kitasatospora sp. NPDC056181 TaxID=3345737 RepID=UPI0035E18900
MTEHPTPAPKPAGAPEPEPIRWFGTSWVWRGSDYRLRRVVVPIGALLATAAAALVLRLAVDGVRLSDNAGFVNGLLLAAVAICSCLSGLRNWKLFAEGKDQLTGWMAEEKSLGAVWIIGGVGALFAYFLRSLVEAPGEADKRARHERATAAHRRRRAGRSGRPDAKAPGRGRRGR